MADEPNATPADTIKVEVKGEVNKRGTYNLPQGSSLLDAINAAGGFTIYAGWGIHLINGEHHQTVRMGYKIKKIEKSPGPILNDGDRIEVGMGGY